MRCLWLMPLTCHYGLMSAPPRTRKPHQKPFWISINARDFGPLFMSWLMPSRSPVGLRAAQSLWKNLHTLPKTRTHWWKLPVGRIVPQYMSWGGFQEECGLLQKIRPEAKARSQLLQPTQSRVATTFISLFSSEPLTLGFQACWKRMLCFRGAVENALAHSQLMGPGVSDVAWA